NGPPVGIFADLAHADAPSNVLSSLVEIEPRQRPILSLSRKPHVRHVESDVHHRVRLRRLYVFEVRNLLSDAGLVRRSGRGFSAFRTGPRTSRTDHTGHRHKDDNSAATRVTTT